ncbi:MAG: cell division ATP-binding protein FtsE [Patescibacteria group bacterium]
MIEFKNIDKKFGESFSLKKVSFKIDKGEFVFLTGPSGAGKTTILRLILKKLNPSDGTIKVFGEDLEEIGKKQLPLFRQKIGMIFQDFKLLQDRTVEENVSLPLIILGKSEEEADEQVKKVLDLVGLSKKANLFPSQLAGGELQRVCIARAVVGQPDLVLADEPTGNLDLSTSWQIVKLLKKINEEGKTVIMATHNFEVVNSLKTRVISLDDGKIISDEEKGGYKIK